jgi:hypothetical protein
MRLRRHPRGFLRWLWPRLRPGGPPPLLGEVSPGFAHELEDLLRQAGRADLVDSAATLPIFGRCPCSDLACASFYTTSWPDAVLEWARAGETIRLRPARGEVSVDVADRRILSVEVLGRRDVWLSLAHLPLAMQANKGDVR